MSNFPSNNYINDRKTQILLFGMGSDERRGMRGGHEGLGIRGGRCGMRDEECGRRCKI